MLLDEPFNGLDFETKSECINLLKDGCFKEGYKVMEEVISIFLDTNN